MDDAWVNVGALPAVGAVVVGRAPATLIVWPCGCSRTGQGAFNLCAGHQGPVFDVIDAQGNGEVAGILNRIGDSHGEA